MRTLVLAAVLALTACTSDPGASGGTDSPGTHALPFGPFTIDAGREISDQCVQITLHNEHEIYVNQVELTTGVGFHHSNWFFVPENVFRADDGTAPDGTYTCKDRNFDQAVAAIFGGVLFAQSTQSSHEVQAFPEGVAIKIPPHSKLVSTIHLLNTGDTALQLSPTIALTTLAQRQVTTMLAAMSFENQALGLPPDKASRFTVECDLLAQDQPTPTNWPAPDFHIYYALPHYHAFGTGMTIEAVKPDGAAATIYSTASKVGDTLGGPLDPPFDFTGYSRLRFTCEYFNTTASTVRWGNGDQEMCVFLAFSDSPDIWGGGATVDELPGAGTDVNGVMNYTHACNVVTAVDASR